MLAKGFDMYGRSLSYVGLLAGIVSTSQQGWFYIGAQHHGSVGAERTAYVWALTWAVSMFHFFFTFRTRTLSLFTNQVPSVF